MQDASINPPSNPLPTTTPTPSKPSHYLLLLLLLTLSLSTATLVCTTKTLKLFYHPQPASPWQPFDLQLLESVRVTSILITLFDVLIVMVVTGLVINPASNPAKALQITARLTIVAAFVALPVIVMLKKSGVQDNNNNNNNKDTAAAQQSWSCGLISLKRQEDFGEWALSVPVDFGRVCGESRFAIHGPLALLIVHLALQIPIMAAFMQVRRPETSDPAGHGEGGDCARGDENARELGDARGNDEDGGDGDKMVGLQSRGESSCPSSSSLQPLGGKGGNRY